MILTSGCCQVGVQIVAMMRSWVGCERSLVEIRSLTAVDSAESVEVPSTILHSKLPTKNLISIISSIGWIFVFNLPNVSFAWGTEGHQVVAIIAKAKLSSKALSEVNRLLTLEPGETLVSISTWADEHRNPATAAWHYVNFPRTTCEYVPDRDCPDGKCVVGAISRQLEVLGSNLPDEKRLAALKYVVHFIADVHQPLHAGYLDDRGGNKYQLQAFMRGSNLHSLWDTGLIRNLDEDADTMAARLLANSVVKNAGVLSMVTAAQESCRIVGEADFYPARKVGQDYVKRYTSVMENRLLLAGARLAGLLNQTLK